MRDEKPSKKLEGSPIIWDNATIIEPANGYCIRATAEEFEAVASYLLSSVALRWPDPDKIEEAGVEDFNEFLRNAAQRIAMQMMARLIICGLEAGMRLRQKTGNPFILQQEQTADTWVDVFDYAPLFEPLETLVSGQPTQEVAVRQVEGALPILQKIWEDFQEKYTGTSESYNPKLTISGETADINRAAICKAVSQTVRAYVAQSIKLKTEEADNLSRVALAIGAGLAVATFVGLIITFPFAVALTPAIIAALLSVGNLAIANASLGLSAVLIQVWAQRIKDTELGVFQDEEAIKDVICIFYGNLKNESDIPAEKFSEALDVSGESANTQALYNAIQPLFQQPVAYPAFLELWLKEINVKDSGITEAACECQVPEIVVSASGGHPLTIIIYEGPEGDNEVFYIRGYFNGVRLGAAINATYDGGGVYLTSIEHVSGPTEDHAEYWDVELGPIYYGLDSADDIPTDRELVYLGVTAEIYAGSFAYRVKFRKEE